MQYIVNQLWNAVTTIGDRVNGMQIGEKKPRSRLLCHVEQILERGPVSSPVNGLVVIVANDHGRVVPLFTFE